MLNNIYFLRHCKTEYNTRDQISGGENISIIDSGIDISELENSDATNMLIMCSPLKRCVETIELLNNKVPYSMKTIIDVRLVERNMGIFQGKERRKVVSAYPDYFTACRFNLRMTPPNGESFEDFFNRVNRFSKDLKNEASLSPVLVSSHNQTLKMLYAILNNMDVNYVWNNINFINGKVTKVIWKSL